MKKSTVVVSLFALVLACALLLPVRSGMAAGNPAGKKLFLDNKCNKCHTIKSEGIEKLPASGGDSGEEAGEAAEKVTPPDLSKLGPECTDVAVLEKFLKKEGTITREGKDVKHKKAFTGSPEDLKTLIQFLQGK
ncbi:MAG TPA: c-type cytochrome [bacterium]|nr:c-type cytochrome [bacterium]